MTVGSMWGVVVPREGRNLLSNPSFELGTVDWAGTASATLGTISSGQAFGAWSLRATGASQGVGATTTATLTNGTAYTASAYVRITGASGGSAQIGIGGTTYRQAVGSAWTRIAVGTTANTTAARTLAVQRFDAASGTLDVDGVQVEAGSITTYLDGDQEGCLWEGAAHASQAIRLLDQRAGGTMIPLAAIGLRPETTPGAGVPPTVNLIQPYAIVDGGEYQQTRYEQRTLTITATMTGTAYPDLATTRRRVIDVLKPRRSPTPAPARLLYWGGGGTVTLDALPEEGFDGAFDNAVSEVVAARFVAPDPMWTDVLDQGTTLPPYTVLGSTNFIAYRDPVGRWGTMGASGSSTSGTVLALAYSQGTLFVGGRFDWAGGTVTRSIAQWTGGAWGTLAGGTLSYDAGTATQPDVRRIIPVSGTLFVGGAWANAGGTRTSSIARHLNGAWGSLGGGTLYNFSPSGGIERIPTVRALVYDSTRGTLYVGGQFRDAGGTRTDALAYHTGGAWGSFGYRLRAQDAANDIAFVNAMARYPSGTLWYTGDVGSVEGPSAPTVGGLAGFNPNGTPFAGPVDFNTNAVTGTVGQALTIGPDQRLYVGMVELARGPSAPALRYVQSGAVPLMGSASPTSFGGAVGAGLFTDTRGDVYAGVSIAAINGGYTVPYGLIRWNGYSWLPPDILLQGNFAPAAGLFDPLGTLYVGGNFNGVGTAASVTTLVNRGMDNSYPVLRMRHTGAGTARVFQLLNTTTGDGLWFDLAMQPGEQAILDLRPENLGFTSSVKGTIINAILGGSNLSTWRLAPGTNTVSFFADNAGVQADLYWRARHLSADGGAEPTL